MNVQSRKYVVITPVRDEEALLPSTIESMIHQTIVPVEWIIVNDGSKDNTGKIIDEFACRNPWIRAVHREDRGFRKSGGGVVDAFNDGYRALTCEDWQFIAKFDGDLTFAPEYFEKCCCERLTGNIMSSAARFVPAVVRFRVARIRWDRAFGSIEWLRDTSPGAPLTRHSDESCSAMSNLPDGSATSKA